MSTNKKNKNALEVIVDVFLDAGYTLFKWMIGDSNNYFDLDKFFRDIELKNKQDIFPCVSKKIKTDISVKYIVSLPVGLELKDFLSIKNALEQQVQQKIDITYKNGYIIIEVFSKELEETIPYRLPSKAIVSNSLKIPVGESIRGTEYIRTDDIAHTLISGTTGSGKSVATRSLLVSLINMYSPKELDIFLLDFKQVELSVFRNVEHCKCFIRDPYEGKEVIEQLMEECQRRYSEFFKYEVNSIQEYNKKNPKNKMKIQAIFIEEFVMMSLAGKKAIETLKRFASLSRASGQFLFLSCQRPDNTVVNNVLKSCLGNRMVFRQEDLKNSIISLDAPGAEKLNGAGHGLLKQGSKVAEFQAYWLSLDEAKEYIKPFIKKENPVSKMNEYRSPNNKSEPVIEAPVIAEDANNLLDLSFLDKL